MNKTQILFRWWIQIYHLQWWNIWCLVDFDSPDHTRSFIIVCFLTSQVHGTKISLKRNCGITYPLMTSIPQEEKGLFKFVMFQLDGRTYKLFCSAKFWINTLLIPKCIFIFLHTMLLSIGYKHPWCFFLSKDGSS